MMNRYEEASKELEKLRSINRTLRSTLKTDSSSRYFSSSRSKPKTSSSLADLDEEYEETNARLERLKRERELKKRMEQAKEREAAKEDQFDSFLTSDMPNLSISRLSERKDDRNVSFNASNYTTRSSKSFTSPESRQFSKLDLMDERPTINSTYYHSFRRAVDENSSSPSRSTSPSQRNRSTQNGANNNNNNNINALNFPDSSFSSNYPSSTSISFPTPSNTSVMAAFRELQNKTKQVENERYLLLKEKDEMKNKLLEAKRNFTIEKNRLEIDTTEALLSTRSSYERLQKTYNDFHYQFLSQKDINETLEKKILYQENLYNSLQQDMIHYQEKLLAAEKHKISLEKTINDSKFRVNDLELTQRLSPQKHARNELPFLQDMNALQSDIQNVQYENQKSEMKITTLQNYIDLIIKINGDLCNTLIQREKAKSKFLRSLSPPPRYTWPKDIPYNNILQVVNDAAKVHASIALENSALKATENAIHSVIAAMSPTSPGVNGRKSPLPRTHRSRTPSPNRFRAPLDDTTHHEDSDVFNSPERINDRLQNSLNTLSKARESYSKDDSAIRIPTTTTTTQPTDQHHHVSFDKHQLNMHSDEDDDDDDDDDDRNMNFNDFRRSALGRFVELSEKPKKKLKKRKTRRSRSTSATGRRNSSTTSHRQHSLERVIARQGAITSATRFAAAANAAANATRIVDNPTPVNAMHRRSMSPTGRNRKDTNTNSSKLSFIPSSGTASNEFNVIASVSKASRAAKQLNASLASKVKSIHSGGMGEMFEEIPRVDLIDMQHQLSAVKKMRESFR